MKYILLFLSNPLHLLLGLYFLSIRYNMSQYYFTSLLSLKDFEDGDILMMSPISHQRLKSIFWRMFEREYVTYEPAMFDEQFLEKGSIGGESCQGLHLLVLEFLTWFDITMIIICMTWIIMIMSMIITNILGLPSMKYFFRNCFPLSPTCKNIFSSWWLNMVRLEV